MLEVRRLSKSYRGIPALRQVTFTVRAGEVLGYVGPNGSGKSTTVKLVTGLLEQDAGQVLFRGQNIRHCMEQYRAALGYVPEEAHVYTHLSGLEYLQLAGRLRGLPEELLEERATRMLELFGLASVRHSPIALYSKGMKQRVLLSAALLHNPDLLVFDEPLSGLDVVSARLFKDLLRSLAEAGKAILYISHVLEVVEQVCDNVVILQDGAIRAYGAPSALKALAHAESLEAAFSTVVTHENTKETAEMLVQAMGARHA